MIGIVLLAAVLAAPGEPAPDVKARIVRLENALLAPCCWKEPVSRHMSEAAAQMRAEIAGQVTAGKSDREILDAYIQRYGRRILVEPEGQARWVALIVPIVFSLIGLWFVVQWVRRWRKLATSGPPPAPLPKDWDDEL